MNVRHLVAALIAVAAVIALASPAQSADRNSLRKPCASVAVAQAIIDQRLVELNETGKSTWVIKKLLPTQAGVVEGRGMIAIADNAPCAFLRGIVDHEWAHIQQDRRYPGRSAVAYGGMDTIESVADCVAQAFGNPNYAPYLAQRGFGCTPYEKQAAQDLINTIYV